MSHWAINDVLFNGSLPNYDMAPKESPAQTVLNAFLSEWDVYAIDKASYAIAATLRALADCTEYTDDCGTAYIDPEEVRAIAAELE
jgi:hypothetical protein